MIPPTSSVLPHLRLNLVLKICTINRLPSLSSQRNIDFYVKTIENLSLKYCLDCLGEHGFKINYMYRWSIIICYLMFYDLNFWHDLITNSFEKASKKVYGK